MADFDAPQITPVSGPGSPEAKPAIAPDDGPGPGAIAVDAEKAKELRGAAAAATEQYLNEQPRRRGPDRTPGNRPSRRRVPVAEVGNSPPETPLPEGAPVPLEIEWENPEPTFDRRAAEALADVGIRLANDAASAIVRAIALHETGDEKLAEAAAKEVRMTEDVRRAIREGAIACAKKYAVQTKYGPEAMLIGGLCAWALPLVAAIKALKAKGRERREQLLNSTNGASGRAAA